MNALKSVARTQRVNKVDYDLRDVKFTQYPSKYVVYNLNTTTSN